MWQFWWDKHERRVVCISQCWWSLCLLWLPLSCSSGSKLEELLMSLRPLCPLNISAKNQLSLAVSAQTAPPYLPGLILALNQGPFQCCLSVSQHVGQYNPGTVVNSDIVIGPWIGIRNFQSWAAKREVEETQWLVRSFCFAAPLGMLLIWLIWLIYSPYLST